MNENNTLPSADNQAAEKMRPASKDEMVGIELEEGICFFVDFVKLQLREHTNPDNVIPLAKMKDTGDHYEFLYDPNTRNIASSPGTQNYKLVFQHLTKLHPDAVARIFNVPLEEVKSRNDKAFFRDLDQLRGVEKEDVKKQRKRGRRL